MTLGIFGTSGKVSEKRLPLHPDHIPMIPDNILQELVFEEDYAKDFGFDISSIASKVKAILPRDEIFKSCSRLLLPKFSSCDNQKFVEDQTIYGWPHCVQGEEITQVAIDKKLTLVAFEAMFTGEGKHKHHIFHKNNEIAGFAAVQHSTELRGITGYYGGRLKALVIGFGSTGRGAVHALQAQGISDITVFTRREDYLIEQQIPGVKYQRYTVSEEGKCFVHGIALCDMFTDADIIVNCILQDPNKSLNFISNRKEVKLKRNSIVVDVSCDEGMGFYFAKPTTFNNPMFEIENTGSHYYSVDHTPSYFWNASTYELSSCLVNFLKYFVDERGYLNSPILRHALEIEEGKIINKEIINFQRREDKYPHLISSI